MTEEWLYQIRIYFSSNFSDVFRSDDTSEQKNNLLQILSNHNADLLSQYDGFMGYVMEAEKNGIDNYPLYHWTKDSLDKKSKIEKYKNSFTVYINSEEVYSKILADNIEKDLLELVEAKKK